MSSSFRYILWLCTVAMVHGTATLCAQQIGVPAVLVNAEGGATANVWRAGPNRVQCLYDASNFTSQDTGQPMVIDSVQFRLGGGLLSTIVTYPSVEIHLQNAAVDFLAPSTTFAANRSVPLTTPNYAGQVTTRTVTGATPNGYFIRIPLTRPFLYSPEAGADLLMEIVISAAPLPLVSHAISTGFVPALHMCNSVRSPGSIAALTGAISPFCPAVRFGYANALGAAVNESYGTGCYDHAASLYELFAGGTADLSGKKVTLTMNGQGGYTATTTAGVVIVPPTGGLSLADDAVSNLQPLPFTFQFPGGSTTGIFVDSNGSIGLSGTATSSIGGSAVAVLALPNVRLMPSMQDLVPDGFTNTDNVFAHVDPGNPSIYLITWRNVPCFGSVATPRLASTFQVALIDSGTNDRVEFRFQSLANDSSSNSGIALTGFSRGSSAHDPGSSDLTVGPISSRAETSRLRLVATSRAVINTNLGFTASNIPASASLSLLVMGLGQDLGTDLGSVGAAGCSAYVLVQQKVTVRLLSAPTSGLSFAVPNSSVLVGQRVYTQAVAFDVAQNALGMISSNGIVSLVGSL